MLAKYSLNNVIMTVFAAAAVAVLTVAAVATGPVAAASTNDIIYGGVSSVSDLKNKYNNGDGRNSAANIQKIYKQALGVTSASQFDGMVSGYVHRDGKITVGSKTVATGANTTGRHNFRNSKPLGGGTTAYYAPASTRFKAGVQKISAFVKIVDGEFAFAVEKSCGNPAWGKKVPKPKPPTPEFVCRDLSASPTSGQFPLKVTFTASESVKNTTVTGYLWDFDGDGTTDQTTTSRSTSHTYADAGTYHATVRIKTAAGTEATVQNPCKASIVVKEQPVESDFRCESLIIDNGDDDTVAPRRVDFAGVASVIDTEVTGYTYVVLDENGNEIEREKIETDQLSVEFSYLFDEPGTYSVYLLVHTADGDTERVSDCEVQIMADTQPPTPEPEPQPEPELPKTGVFTATAGVAGTTGLWVGARKWLESRRKLLQSLLNK